MPATHDLRHLIDSDPESDIDLEDYPDSVEEIDNQLSSQVQQ